MNRAIRIHEKDNVAVLLCDAEPGTAVEAGGITVLLTQAVPFGHKVALRDLAKDEVVYKYGQPIGHCTCAVPAGSWVHTHNCESLRGGVAK